MHSPAKRTTPNPCGTSPIRRACWSSSTASCPGSRRSRFMLLGVGLYLSFFVAPPDYQQGETVKIMFIHVPSAWLAMFGYTLIAIASTRHAHLAPSPCRRRRQDRGADRRHLHLHRARHRLAVGQADVGHLLGVGRAAHLGARAVPALSRADRALEQSIEEPGRAGRAAAILALVGVVNVPIINYSVDVVEHAAPASERLPRSAARPSIHRCSPRSSSWRSPSPCSSCCYISSPCAPRSCAAACTRCSRCMSSTPR